MPSPHTEPEWTPYLVKEYLLRVMDERDKRYEQRFMAQEAATAKVLSYVAIILSLMGVAVSFYLAWKHGI